MPVCICIIPMQRPIAGEFELLTKGFDIQYDINYYDINTVLWLICLNIFNHCLVQTIEVWKEQSFNQRNSFQPDNP